VPYTVPLLLGLVCGVYAMLYGMRHHTVTPYAPATLPSLAVLNWTVPAAALLAFGAAGAIAQRAGATTLPASIIAGVSATAATVAQIALSRWALTAPRNTDDQPTQRLQGLPATILAAIPANGLGRIRYAIDQQSHEAPARALDGTAMLLGEEVVIERIDTDGTAILERWASVAARL
jgi:membrane protein implicated in regulation of membrane protease activity